jgi:hypothetical protein
MMRVYDAGGDVIETHEHAGDFTEPFAARQVGATEVSTCCALSGRPRNQIACSDQVSGVISSGDQNQSDMQSVFATN